MAPQNQYTEVSGLVRHLNSVPNRKLECQLWNGCQVAVGEIHMFQLVLQSQALLKTHITGKVRPVLQLGLWF
jgi:hypothetical protein